ncbi:MAG: hypothetical protein H0X26_03895 [Alphaproteobacteria bacterium]|nr:hypothetical protein [Alphaproteobacteria bacterium]
MRYPIKESDRKVIYQNLQHEKGLHIKNEEKLRFFMKPFGMLPEQEVSGVLFQPIRAIGELYIVVFVDGHKEAPGNVCWKT